MRATAKALGAILNWVVIALMVILTVIVVLAVIYRKLGASFSWYDEVAGILLVWITYYGSALAALNRAHIGFDGLLLALPRSARRISVFAAEVLVLTFFGLLTWAGLKVLAVLQGMSLVSLSWVPVTFTQSVIPIGATLFIIAEILSFPDYYRDVMRGISSEHPPMEDLTNEEGA